MTRPMMMYDTAPDEIPRCEQCSKRLLQEGEWHTISLEFEGGVGRRVFECPSCGHPNTEPRPQTKTHNVGTDELFTSRLYAGQVGSGKSVTIDQNIRTLLDADEDFQVIDIAHEPFHDRPEIESEFGTFADLDDVGYATTQLHDAIWERAYACIDAERDVSSEEPHTRRVRHVLEHAFTAAKGTDKRVAIVIDDLPRGFEWGDELEEVLATCRKHGVALWVADQEPFQSGLAREWTGAGGEIVLHSALEPPVENLSDDERDHVARPPRYELGDNPVLVGQPGQWRKDTIDCERS